MRDPLVSTPRVETVDPAKYDALAEFTCGGQSPYEREVDEIVWGFWGGHSPTWMTFQAATDPDADDALVAVSCVHLRPVPRLDPGAMYVAVIGINEPYRGRCLPDGETRLGDFMLHQALCAQERTWGGTRLLWALVDRTNAASEALVERAGFDRVALDPNTYDMWLRAPRTPIPDDPPVA